MNKLRSYIFAVLLPMLLIAIIFGCQAKRGPSTPYDLPFTPTPTPVLRIYGPVNVFVEDKGVGVPNLAVSAIPPSGNPIWGQMTAANGTASFNPPFLEVGTWTFVVPAQTPFPYAPSTLAMAVTAINETANFNTAGATLQLTPPVPAAYSGTSGGVFVYGVNYAQPGGLLVPVKLYFPSFPPNWTAIYGPTTFGFAVNDDATVTVTGTNCVDQSPSFAVTGMDLEPTPYPRAWSDPQTIIKNFPSTVTVSWTSTFTFQSLCGLLNFTQMYQTNGTLNVSVSNGCNPSVAVTVSWTTGDCCTNQLQTPNGNIGASNCGGGSLQFGPGTYNCSINSGVTRGTFNVSFKGQSKTTDVPASGTVQILNAIY